VLDTSVGSRCAAESRFKTDGSRSREYGEGPLCVQAGIRGIGRREAARRLEELRSEHSHEPIVRRRGCPQPLGSLHQSSTRRQKLGRCPVTWSGDDG
jgi:hypothetical protein